MLKYIEILRLIDANVLWSIGWGHACATIVGTVSSHHEQANMLKIHMWEKSHIDKNDQDES